MAPGMPCRGRLLYDIGGKQREETDLGQLVLASRSISLRRLQLPVSMQATAAIFPRVGRGPAKWFARYLTGGRPDGGSPSH